MDDKDFEEFYQHWLKCDPEDAFYDFCMGVPASFWHYVRCREAGTSPSLAIMFATGATPELKGTNAQFTAGWSTEDQFNSTTPMGKHLDEKYRADAKAAGVSTTGRRYLHSVARYQGDPAAWVADTSDVLRLAREQNFSVDGAVRHTAEKRDPADDPKQTGRPAAA